MRTCVYQLFLRHWEDRLMERLRESAGDDDNVYGFLRRRLETVRCARIAERQMLKADRHVRGGDRRSRGLYQVAYCQARDIFQEILR